MLLGLLLLIVCYMAGAPAYANKQCGFNAVNDYICPGGGKPPPNPWRPAPRIPPPPPDDDDPPPTPHTRCFLIQADCYYEAIADADGFGIDECNEVRACMEEKGCEPKFTCGPADIGPPISCACEPPRPGGLLGGFHLGRIGISYDVMHNFAGRDWNSLSGRGAGSRIDWAAQIQRETPCLKTVISYPGIPNPPNPPPCPTSTLNACIAGQYDGYYQSYGQAMKAAGLRGTILRVGWEWNIQTNKGMCADSDITKAPLYAACFRRIVQQIEAQCPECETVFDYNSNGTINEAMLRAGYPGDDVVDIISVEGYDNGGPEGNPVARWAFRKRILDMVRDFARERGKSIAIPEWGIWNCNAGGCSPKMNHGGDNPLYVENMCKYAKDPSNNVYYYIYFNGSDRFPWHDLNNPINSRSRAAFLEYCDCGPEGPPD